MYIQPNSDIILLRKIPLDSTYRHTIRFQSATQQSDYFITQSLTNGNQIAHLTNYSYQRVNKGVIKIQKKADELYDCNYMCFRNTNFGQKWFYCFVNKVDYVNNETASIEYEIDVMQTYFFNFSFTDTFVERCHTYSDYVGEHILPEPVQTGDTICSEIICHNGAFNYSDYCLVVAYTLGDSLLPISDYGGIYCNTFSGVNYGVLYPFDGETYLEQTLDFIRGCSVITPYPIISMYLFPKAYVNVDSTNSYKNMASVGMQFPKYQPYGSNDEAPKYTFDGYTPKNNKLYSYPYNYLLVDCGTDSAIWKYELFTPIPEQVTTVACGNYVGIPQIMLQPVGYNGKYVVNSSSEDTFGIATLNATEKLVISGFPQCACASDSFLAWLSQNAVSSFTRFNNDVVTGANSIFGNGGIDGLGHAVNDVIGMGLQTEVNAFQMQGKIETSSGADIDVNARTKNFFYKRMQVQNEYAKYIDSFFDQYGYNVSCTMTPNIDSRPYWNYLKTKNCKIVETGIPNDDVVKIEKIFDNGITFWHDVNEIGHYNLDNSPEFKN